MTFAEALPPSAACPACGVYFFKLAPPVADAKAEQPAPLLLDAQRDTPRRATGGIMLLLGLAGVLAIVGRQATQPQHTSVAPQSSSAPNANSSASPATDETVTKQISLAESDALPLAPDIDPEILNLHQSPDVVFDMREEVYRIANLNGIALDSIQFYGNEIKLQGDDGTRVAASAFALPSLRNNQRVCDVRVIRPADDLKYQPGQATTRLVNLIRRTTIAHELSHCVDWYQGGLGWSTYGPTLPPARDPLNTTDQWRRWREEFADLHAIVLLNQALGNDEARLAMKARALERKVNPVIWYRHAHVALQSGEALQSTTPEDTERLIAKYWAR